MPAHREDQVLVLCPSQPALSLCHFLLEQWLLSNHLVLLALTHLSTSRAGSPQIHPPLSPRAGPPTVSLPCLLRNLQWLLRMVLGLSKVPLPQLLALCLKVYASETLKPPVRSCSPPKPHVHTCTRTSPAPASPTRCPSLSLFKTHLRVHLPQEALLDPPVLFGAHLWSPVTAVATRQPVTRACALCPSGPCAPLANRHSVNAWSFDLIIHHEQAVTSFTSRIGTPFLNPWLSSLHFPNLAPWASLAQLLSDAYCH